MTNEALKTAYKGELVKLNAVEQGIADLREKYGTVPDVTNKEGYTLCKKGIQELTSTRTKADKLRLEITEPHRDFIKQVNDYGKEIIERIEAIEQPLKEAKKTEDERAEREKEARIAKLRERIQSEILSFMDTAQGLDSTSLAELHDAATQIDTDGFFDVTAEAEDAKASVLKHISEQHGQALERERLAAEQAEVEAERRRLREESEKREAEQKELEELRRFKAEQEVEKQKREACEGEAKRQAEEAEKRKPEPKPEPEPLPAAAEHKPLDTSRLSTAADNFQRGSQVKTPEEVTISRKEYDRLLEAKAKLIALEAAGVDNWSGYDDAMQQLAA
ncbi:hypothetical protein [Halomonas sp. hl-4]|uniref:hypothetical protein n=1 Tax=Halomonas sp. hl-4 TaxID=1761789 RepID=UPI000BB89D6E|nr:hypothetical protein [Halomonas sp. hl-4]SNY95524.1 hypothetical protein SAMN04488142_0024 [Halomonas sp. hl-4]